MLQFDHFSLVTKNKDYELILYVKQANEFSEEFDNKRQEIESPDFMNSVREFIKEKLPDFRISAVKVIIGTTLISSFTISPVFAQEQTTSTSYTNHVVKAGDTLWRLSQQYNVSIDSIRELNKLYTNTLYIGQSLKIPSKVSNTPINIVINGQNQSFTSPPVIIDGVTLVPLRDLAEAIGASIWYNSESRTIGLNKGDTKIAFIVGSTTARVNGESITTAQSQLINGKAYVPLRFVSEVIGLNVDWDATTKTVYISDQELVYRVKSGDSLWLIARTFNTSITAIKETNNLTTDTLYVGQQLVIPNNQVNTTTPPAIDQTNRTEPYVTYETHTVVQGDNLWNLSIKYGIPLTELLKVNNLTMASSLTIGQELQIPVHHIPVKPVVSEKHGELLDWWTEAQYVFQIGDVAKITDLQTGRSWNVKRTIGANHADSEPLTSEDAAIMKEVWGGEYSWKARAVIVEVDGRRIAASMTSYPHDIEYIKDNNFPGHFDIHFLNSTRHSDGQISDAHQQQVKIAAGLMQ